MKVVFAVPLYDGSEPYDWWDEINSFVKAQNADVVIFPEGYAEGPKRLIADTVQKIARAVDTPTLCGYSVKNHPQGPRTFETSGFYNPHPKRGETKSRIYVRHCHTYPAWDWPNYKGQRDPIYQPFVVGGVRFGVQHCQDIFYPRVTAEMIKHGAEVHIGLSSDNLKIQKWASVVKGRSAENDATFLQVAGKDPAHFGKHSVIAYRGGEPLPLWVPDGLLVRESNPYELPEAPVIVMVDLDKPPVKEPDRKSISKGFWDDITMTLGRNGTPADIKIQRRNGNVLANGKPLHIGGWNLIDHKMGAVAVLPLPGDQIKNPLAIPDAPDDGKHMVVVYLTDGDIPKEQVKALVEMRAVEGWIAVFAWEERIGAKANMMRGLQKLVETDGVFGFDAHNMPGSKRVFPKDISNDRNAGLRGYLKEKYEGLGN